MSPLVRSGRLLILVGAFVAELAAGPARAMSPPHPATVGLRFYPAAAHAAGQPEPGTLRAVRVSIELAHESADPEVTLHYVLRVPAGTRSIAIRLVEFFGAEPREISATAGGRALALDARRSGPLWEGELFLPEPAQADTAMGLDIQYSVANARRGRGDRFDFAIPLLLVTWSPEASADTFFTAEIRLPEEAYLSEAFPTVPLTIAATPGVRSHTMTLPVVPSLVRFRGGIGTPPLLGFAGLVDVSIGLLLGGLALLGWRRLRAGD